VLGIPSAKLVVVCLGLSLPDGDDVGFEDLVEDVIRALEVESVAPTLTSRGVARSLRPASRP
jgi:hypothetical protein